VYCIEATANASDSLGVYGDILKTSWYINSTHRSTAPALAV